ncbi:MAG: hypothetical protein JNL08_10705 [Planctomycetes bacterium]|nr:hypothetical protein [Planctomycetota bacterium]
MTLAGIDGTIYAATRWTPPGGANEVLVFGGVCTAAGNVPVQNIAVFDPVTGAWSGLGSGIGAPSPGGSSTDIVLALAVLPTGELAAAGGFSLAGGAPANNIAKWNGSAWVPLGGGTNGPVHSLAVDGNELYVGGYFDKVDVTIGSQSIARWNVPFGGWTAMPVGPLGGVHALMVAANGDLYAGGSPTASPGVPGDYIARFAGNNWHAVGTGLAGIVNALVQMPNGDIVAGGEFVHAGATVVNHVARWNGAQWQAIGAGTDYPVTALAAIGPDLWVGGWFSLAGGLPSRGVAFVQGTTWFSPLAGVTGYVYAITSDSNARPVVAGYIAAADTTLCQNVVTWAGNGWAALEQGNNLSPEVVATLPDGTTVVGGSFAGFGGVLSSNIAMRVAGTWRSLGGGFGAPLLDRVHAIAALPNGTIVASGTSWSPTGTPTGFIVAFDGGSWSSLGAGTNGIVYALLALPNGDLVATGDFTAAGTVAAKGVARWDGTTWHAMGTGLNAGGSCAALLPNGDIVIGDYFQLGGSGPLVANVTRWDGSTWSPLGTNFNGRIESLAVDGNGEIIAGGTFTSLTGANAVARWNGTSWSQIGAGIEGSAFEVLVLPGGDILAGGALRLPGAQTFTNVLRFDGTAWSTVDGGTSDVVWSMAAHASGDVEAVGNFTRAGTNVSAFLARLTTSCPAAADTVGLGCASSGGANDLQAANLPWTHLTRTTNLTTIGTGLPASGFALSMTSLTGSSAGAPLTLLLPGAAPSCNFYTLPDILNLVAINGGTGSLTLPLVATPSLGGVTFFQQWIVFDAAPNPETSTNGLQFRGGLF